MFAPYLAAAVSVARPATPRSIPLPATCYRPRCFSRCSAWRRSARWVSSRPGSARGALGVLVRVIAAIANAAALSALLSYFVPALRMDRSMLLTTAVISMVTSFFVRLLVRAHRRRRLFSTPGARSMAPASVHAACSNCAGARTRAVSGSSGSWRRKVTHIIVPPERVIARPADLFEWAIAHNVDEIVVAMDDRRRGFPMDQLLECRLEGVEILELVTFLERETGKVRLDMLNPSWMIFSEGFRQGRDPDTRSACSTSSRACCCSWPRRSCADRVGHQVRRRSARADPLSAGARRSLRPAVQRAEVPQHASRRREGRQAQWAQRTTTESRAIGAFIRKIAHRRAAADS